MVVDGGNEKIAAVESEDTEVSKLKSQIEELTVQVTVLTTQRVKKPIL